MLESQSGKRLLRSVSAGVLALGALGGCGSPPARGGAPAAADVAGVGKPAAATAPLPTTAPSSQIETLYRQSFEAGMTLFRQGRFTEAAAELTKAQAAHPADARVLRVLGNARARANDLVRARLAFEASIDLDPMQPGTHFELAQVALAAGDLELARRESDKTLALDPTNARAQESLGMVLYRQGDTEAAARVLEPAVASGKARPEARFLLGLCLEQQGQTERARDLFLRVVSQEPNHADAWLHLGTVLAELGDEKGAGEANARSEALRATPEADQAKPPS